MFNVRPNTNERLTVYKIIDSLLFSALVHVFSVAVLQKRVNLLLAIDMSRGV